MLFIIIVILNISVIGIFIYVILISISSFIFALLYASTFTHCCIYPFYHWCLL